MSDRFSQDPKEVTLEDAKQWLRERFEGGAPCPCCNQHVKLYKRKLNSGMARTLCWIVRESGPGQWVAVAKTAPKEILRSNEHGKLAHWGLVEQQEVDPGAKGKTSGVWRATPRGRSFALNEIEVPSHVFLYNNEPLKFSKTSTSIVSALGDGFDYNELMRAT